MHYPHKELGFCLRCRTGERSRGVKADEKHVLCSLLYKHAPTWMPQAPGSADSVQGTSSSGSLVGGNPTAPSFGGGVRIPNIVSHPGDVGAVGTLPDQPEPEEASQVPAEESASQPTFHLEMVRQQRKLEQVSPDLLKSLPQKADYHRAPSEGCH